MATRKGLQTMTGGQTLSVLSSESDSSSDFKAYVKSSCDTLLESKKTPDGGYEFLLKRV